MTKEKNTAEQKGKKINKYKSNDGKKKREKKDISKQNKT